MSLFGRFVARFPKILGVTLSTTIAVSSIGLAPIAAASVVTTQAAAQVGSFDQQMIQLVNAARVAHGVPALTEARGLTTVSVWWSTQLSSGSTGYQLAHNPNAWNMVASNGASNRTSWGENVAWSSSTGSTAQQIFTAYMNSPGHRANILSVSYHFIGMGTVTGSHGLWNTTEFTDKVQAGQTVVVLPQAMAVTKARALVSAWYLAVLGRPVDAASLTARSGTLVSGSPMTTQLRTIVMSTEALNRQVSYYFVRYLHRTADAPGVAARVAQIRAGGDLMVVAAGLLGSYEAFARAGGTNDAWARFAFLSVMGYAPSAAQISLWSGVASRSGLMVAARSLVTSVGGRTTRVEAYYRVYLGRVGDAGGIAAWVARQSTEGEINVQVAFLTSSEFVAKHG